MTTLNNEITIAAPIDRIWETLSNVDNLDKYDPTIKKVNLLTEKNSGLGVKRKVEMLDGKNWFEETCTEYVPNKSLIFELSACSFPVQNLKHTYSFEQFEGKVKVKQQMTYNMKFGLLGKLMDVLMVRKKSDNGIKLFMEGLKSYTEKVD